MDQPVRRVVTTHDDKGKAVVLFNGIAPNRTVRRETGIAATLLWVTDCSPARFSGWRDTADVKIGCRRHQRARSSGSSTSRR